MVAWDQDLALGEKGKKIGERSEPRGSLGRGKGPFPPPQATAGLSSLADIFPIQPRFCLFFPLRSLVPG